MTSGGCKAKNIFPHRRLTFGSFLSVLRKVFFEKHYTNGPLFLRIMRENKISRKMLSFHRFFARIVKSLIPDPGQMPGHTPECWIWPKTPNEAGTIRWGVVYPFQKQGGDFMTQKERRRENRRKKHQREALIEMRNMYGNKDLTPYNAVLQIRTNGKATIRLS